MSIMLKNGKVLNPRAFFFNAYTFFIYILTCKTNKKNVMGNPILTVVIIIYYYLFINIKWTWFKHLFCIRYCLRFLQRKINFILNNLRVDLANILWSNKLQEHYDTDSPNKLQNTSYQILRLFHTSNVILWTY